MEMVGQRHARLSQHRNVKSHRIDDPDVTCGQFALDRRDICWSVGGTTGQLAGVVMAAEPRARSMLSRTEDHISLSATYPRAALWPSATICADTGSVKARMMMPI